MRVKYAPTLHLYLMALAVVPALQGQGYGDQLLRRFFADAQQRHLPCYLETFKPKNEAIYHHYGFQTMEIYLVPGTSLTLFSMLRPT